ncbi:phosphoribosylformylglycinamidine synthase subunit PurQ [Paracoccus sp. S-4012]|uniref:phosphoribosylformylglycinamidine synthase subunit PurQ n=1 Tax=Paracoccus sp. S-4012 TaxID=2665648 RepID=UPI0012B03F20|nr:phosphoribosylformylglycinamidine synthase subunit PurQ [Paracoccus sp. S-4012]MRX50263.1 phosphoribosylformylglycinamidine synthase subunit PurQ [Paracoccus sp. S-4012]
MKAAVITFPGSNCDRDLAVALEAAGAEVARVWHKETVLPEGTDLVAVPGGFSYGDYLRCGAIAARSPVAGAIREHAGRGGYVLGVCNGFQVLTELGLLPGALMRNAGLSFICRDAALTVETDDSAFTCGYARGARISLPVAHHDGNYQIDPEGLARLTGEDRIALTYATPLNGSAGDIAGVLSANRRTLGLMPHPERAADPALGPADGARMLRRLVGSLVAA